MADNRMCPHCRAFVDSKEKICPYCGGEVARRLTQPVNSSAAGPMSSDAHFTTLIILTINFGLYVAMMVLTYKLGQEDLFGIHYGVLEVFGAKARYNILLGGEWWRLVTAGFLHAGIVHILMNSWVLFDLGAQVEHTFGTSRFLVIYLLSSVVGFFASMYWTPALSTGASAALCGLIGAMMAYAKRTNQSFIWSMYMRWMIIIVIIGLIIPVIDNAAHLGGFAGGFAIGYLAGSPTRNADTESLWKAAAALACIVAVAALAMAYQGISEAIASLQP